MSTEITAPAPIDVIASTPTEMVQSQNQLIAWCGNKIANLLSEKEAFQADHDRAKQNKWNPAPFARMVAKVEKQITFYTKVRTALEHGYCIVPNFPMDVFAIRTKRSSPTGAEQKMSRWGVSFAQSAQALPEAEGEYQNPFPMITTRREEEKEDGKIKSVEYGRPSDWQEDIDFPIQMAKPRIMDLTDQAMALALFDEIGISPPKPKKDPMIIGTIIDGSRKAPYHIHRVSFLIAWHINTGMI